jgi:hypothetical protein
MYINTQSFKKSYDSVMKLRRDLAPVIIKNSYEYAIPKAVSVANRYVRIRTGYLKSTIYTLILTTELTLRIGAKAHYAYWVERRYPFIKPAVIEAVRAYKEALAKNLRAYRIS